MKTPRVVVRDDGELTASTSRGSTTSTRDPEVKTDLNRKAGTADSASRSCGNGYYFLGKDWLETAKKWKKSKQPTPPVMITVANTIHTAARVEYAFEHKRINIEELCDPEKILHIDSRFWTRPKSKRNPCSLGSQQCDARGRGRSR